MPEVMEDSIIKQHARFWHGDCLEIMRTFPNDCVDLVFCSPPYETARTYGIDFNLRGQAWVDWCLPRYLECVRICKGLVAWVVEGQTRQFRYSAAPILLMADLHRAGVKLRKPPAFARVGIPGSGGPDWLRNDYEFIVCSTKGKLPWSDNTAMGHPPKWAPGGEMSNRVSNGTRRNQWGHSGTGDFGSRKANGERKSGKRPSHVIAAVGKRWGEGGDLPETKNGDAIRRQKVMTRKREGMHNQEQCYQPPAIANPGNIIKGLVGGGVMGSKLAHENEAPFPESLPDFFIRSFCPLGGSVFDPFCGSGTTIAAAIKAGRRGAGIDIRDSQIDLMRRRAVEAIGSLPREAETA